MNYIYSNWLIHVYSIVFLGIKKNDYVLNRKGFFEDNKIHMGEIRDIDSCTVIAYILEVIIFWTDSVKLTTTKFQNLFSLKLYMSFKSANKCL